MAFELFFPSYFLFFASLCGLWLHRIVSMYHNVAAQLIRRRSVFIASPPLATYVHVSSTEEINAKIYEKKIFERNFSKKKLFALTLSMADLWKRIKCDMWCHRHYNKVLVSIYLQLMFDWMRNQLSAVLCEILRCEVESSIKLF